MISKQIHIKRFLNIALVMLLLIVTVIGGRGIIPAFADTSVSSNILEDLQKDSSFTVSDYPDNLTDYTIKIIQIAEGKSGDLYIYTYQPSQKAKYLVATDINMSLTESANGIKHYGLKFINANGVFAKYLVTGFTVSKSEIRYYNITSIFRAWDSTIDAGTGNDNTISGVSNKVGQLWLARTSNGTVNYSMTYTETIEVTNKFVGSVRYPNGVSWFTTGACDSHFVAFSTDKRIDKLLEADLTFIAKTYDKNIFGTSYGKEEEITPPTLTYSAVTGNNVNGLFAKTYTWNRIQSVSEFVSDKDFDTAARAEISKQQWVLNFYETDYKSGIGGATAIVTGLFGMLIASTFSSGTLVSDVTILRLGFETEGKTYNLGVVDNKQTGSDKPIGQPEKTGFFAFIGNCFAKIFNGTAEWWEIAVVVFLIVVAIVVVVLLIKFIKWVYRGLFK